MRLVAGVYVDHQEEILFPVGFITENMDMFDAIYLFGADEANTSLMREVSDGHRLSSKMICVTIGAGISRPGDIAATQNRCVDWLRSNDSFDYLVLLQADLRITEDGMRFIREFLYWGDSGRPVVMMKVQHIMLHTVGPRNQFGAALIGRNSDGVSFVGDGAYTEKYWISSDHDEIWHVLSVGYLGLKQCRRHISRHAKTWNDSALSHMASLDDPREFMKACLWRNKSHNLGGAPLKMMPEDNKTYSKAILNFGIRKEISQVAKIIRSEGW